MLVMTKAINDTTNSIL